jgi:hypothetical protein
MRGAGRALHEPRLLALGGPGRLGESDVLAKVVRDPSVRRSHLLPGLHMVLQTCPISTGGMDETCPVGTGGRGAGGPCGAAARLRDVTPSVSQREYKVGALCHVSHPAGPRAAAARAALLAGCACLHVHGEHADGVVNVGEDVRLKPSAHRCRVSPPRPAPRAPRPAPRAPRPAPRAPRPAPRARRPAPRAPRPAPRAPRPAPRALRPAPCAPRPAPCRVQSVPC